MIRTKIDAAAALAGLQALAKDVQQPALKAGLRPIGRALRVALVDLIPNDTGRTDKSISAVQLSQAAGTRIGVLGGDASAAAILVGPNRKVNGKSRRQVFNILDEGAKAHSIKPKRGRVLTVGDAFSADAVRHPGVRALRLQDQALARVSPQIESLFYAGLSKYLAKYSA